MATTTKQPSTKQLHAKAQQLAKRHQGHLDRARKSLDEASATLHELHVVHEQLALSGVPPAKAATNGTPAAEAEEETE